MAARAERSIADSRGGALALGALNGTSGDQLAGWEHIRGWLGGHPAA